MSRDLATYAVLPGRYRRIGRHLNTPMGDSHRPTRCRKCPMLRSKSPCQAWCLPAVPTSGACRCTDRRPVPRPFASIDESTENVRPARPMSRVQFVLRPVAPVGSQHGYPLKLHLKRKRIRHIACGVLPTRITRPSGARMVTRADKSLGDSGVVQRATPRFAVSMRPQARSRR